jgi:hypothetical protein
MSEQDLKQDQEAIEDSQPTELDEFKASMGDPSEVPEPTSTTATAPGPSKDQGDKVPPKQGSSKMEKPKEVGTKMGMINAMLKKMNGMNKEAVGMMYNMAMMPKDKMGETMNKMMTNMKMPVMSMKKPKMGEETEYKVTAADVDVKDDVKALFGEEDLSEEFKEKAATIFETAVVTKINEHIENYKSTINESFAQDTQAIKDELSEKMDTYLDYVVESWAKDNELAIEQGLKAELTEDFMSGLKNLFEDHYIDIPETKVDVVEELAAKNEELQSQLNAEMEKNMEAKKAIEENDQQKIIDQVTEGLAETQKEKFQTLAEGVEFNDKESFQKKLSIIKESYFSVDNDKEVADLVGETDEPLDEEAKPEGSSLDPKMAGYAAAISRSLKK